MCAENYQNRNRFDKDIAKIKQCSFLPHMVDTDGVSELNSSVASVLCAYILRKKVARRRTVMSLCNRFRAVEIMVRTYCRIAILKI